MSVFGGDEISFDASQGNSLRRALPDFSLDAPSDSAWLQSDLVQAYLDFYQINFVKTGLAAKYIFGGLNLLDFRIATHCWLPNNPKGTLVIVHGYYDHVGIYGKAIAFGLENNLAVVAFDLPGHGISSGAQAAISSFDQYADVLEGVLQKVLPELPQPFYALGQSTGGACLLNHLWRYENQRDSFLFARTALCAPLILPRDWNKGRYLYALMHRFVRRLPRGNSISSHDLDFIGFIDHKDPLQSKFLSVRWVGAMKAWDQQFKQFDVIDRPLLVIQGTQDRTIAWRYNLELIAKKLPQAKIHYIPNAGHQLVNESLEFRQQVFQQISQYFFE